MVFGTSLPVLALVGRTVHGWIEESVLPRWVKNGVVLPVFGAGMAMAFTACAICSANMAVGLDNMLDAVRAYPRCREQLALQYRGGL